MKKYSFDRHGNIIDVTHLYENKNPSEELINVRHALEDFRGVYDSLKVAEKMRDLNKPIEVRTGTGPNDYYFI